MRVAALYDVHGNLPALEAVLAEVDDLEVDRIVVGGDVAAGAWPRETLARLRVLGDRVLWIRGNADRELAEGGEEPLLRRVPPLDDDARRFLGALPLTAALELDALGRVLFCHATPTSDELIVTPSTAQPIFEARFAGADADVVVCGHTHMQYDRRAQTTRVVNAGSVGMSYDEPPGAYWALLERDVELRRTAYDVEATYAAIERIFGEWPRATREEATTFFERLAGERGER